MRECVYGGEKGERKRVAEAAGISATYLYMICTGRKPLDSMSLAQRIASATNGRIHWRDLMDEAAKLSPPTPKLAA